MAVEGGYDPVIVLDWLDTHSTKRTEDGRYWTLCGRLLDDSHRDTFARWVEFQHRPGWVVPLGRWDELLMFYGLMLGEFERWAEELYGWDAYLAGEDL